jgi:hypothetical protein
MSRDEDLTWRRISSTVQEVDESLMGRDDDEDALWDPLWEFVLGDEEQDRNERNERAGRRSQDCGVRQTTDIDGRHAGFWRRGKTEEQEEERWEWQIDPDLFSKSPETQQHEARPKEKWKWQIDPLLFSSSDRAGKSVRALDHKKRCNSESIYQSEQKWPPLFQPSQDQSEASGVRRLFRPFVAKTSLVKSIQKLKCAPPPISKFDTKSNKGYQFP